MQKNAHILNAAWLYSQVQKKRILANLKRKTLTDFGRQHYLLQLGHYTELADLAEPYKNFIFPLEMLIEGTEDRELETLPQCKAFIREFRRKVKEFYQAGGTKEMPESLVDFFRQVKTQPLQLKGNEKGIKIINYLLESHGEGPDVFYGDRDDYKSITETFKQAPNSRIESLVILFSQLDSLSELDLTLSVPKIRKAIQGQMGKFRELLG